MEITSPRLSAASMEESNRSFSRPRTSATSRLHVLIAVGVDVMAGWRSASKNPESVSSRETSTRTVEIIMEFVSKATLECAGSVFHAPAAALTTRRVPVSGCVHGLRSPMPDDQHRARGLLDDRARRAAEQRAVPVLADDEDLRIAFPREPAEGLRHGDLRVLGDDGGLRLEAEVVRERGGALRRRLPRSRSGAAPPRARSACPRRPAAARAAASATPSARTRARSSTTATTSALRDGSARSAAASRSAASDARVPS